MAGQAVTRRQSIMDAITSRSYVLGHCETELRRLAMQSAFWGELTEEIFRRAGIGIGMRVLDVGCGPGDVSFSQPGWSDHPEACSASIAPRMQSSARRHGPLSKGWATAALPLRMWRRSRRTSALMRSWADSC